MLTLSKAKGLALLVLFAGLFSATGCTRTSPEEYNSRAADPNLLHQTSKQLTTVIIRDIFKPPVASRIYSYANLAAYEAMRPAETEYPTLAGRIREFSPVPAPEEGGEYCYPLASVKAFIAVSKALTFSVDMWDEYEVELNQKYEAMDIPQDVYDRSVAYGELVARHVLDYAEKDNYKYTRGYRHVLTYSEGEWEPTPPTYAEACEPKWNEIRAFTLDSCTQFTPAPPAPYDLTPGSEFRKMLDQVYDYGKNATPEQKAIAYFWDDNATVSNIKGHLSYLSKKMTPPGHWQAIVSTIARNQKLDMMQSLQAYTFSSIAMHEAFIACWEEKYRSNRVRPITVINKLLGEGWEPYLETPPFPEYVSGHSAISASAGTVLTHLLGENVAFTDSTEYEFGHGVRSFKSIEDAYMETSMSRVYGGIHYLDGALEGTKQGERVGEWVLTKLTGKPVENKPKEDVTKQIAGK
ncbi:phosphatase PAP2 family protein [Pontibacter diazotrophicus]|uniref:Phosphatase PAP2 family protein n=1 Tax=Pontibacter diazotrophicus TaxID=1400979 RepID=A0A3D8L0H3_9BACT|nr:vanadium-dependent haloperoxidase [Pontibacter diazotrophicus]RDV10717.1 phosphatase PAP2 family protein [Pontibacter diazotrophicus]